MTIHFTQKKNVVQTTNFYDWIEDLFSAVSQVLSEWVNTYQILSENKIEADTLNFHDIIKTLWVAAAHKTCRSMRIAKDTFEFSFVSEKTQSLEKDISEFNEKSINEQKKKNIRAQKIQMNHLQNKISSILTEIAS